MRLPHNSHVLVADGRKLLLLRNEGDDVAPNLQVVRVETHPNPADRDQGTDEPGRAFSSAGQLTGRSAYSETDFHQLEEDRFAAEAADILKRGALAGDFEQLIIVAPPRTLGELRKHYHKEVEQLIGGEVAKDLTGHPVDQIERILIDHD